MNSKQFFCCLLTGSSASLQENSSRCRWVTLNFTLIPNTLRNCTMPSKMKILTILLICICLYWIIELPIVIHMARWSSGEQCVNFPPRAWSTTHRRTWHPATISGRKNSILLDLYQCHQRDVDNNVLLSLQNRRGWLLNSRGDFWIDFFSRHAGRVNA